MSASSKQGASGASPYSTGGGGTVLEHRYGAFALTALLTGEPLPGLGDSITVSEVAFQASPQSRVDDLLISGHDSGGQLHRLSVAVRRDPNLVESDEKAAALIGAFLTTLLDHEQEVTAGRWHLALAVASPNTHALELRKLAEIARGQGDEQCFREVVARAGTTTMKARGRLEQLEKLIGKSIEQPGFDLRGHTPGELCWLLLQHLHVLELRLEGSDQSDLALAAGRLRQVLADPQSEPAEQLLAKLTDLAGTYAPIAARVNAGMLRAALAGTVRLKSSGRNARAQELLASLRAGLWQHTGSHLRHGDTALELERPEALNALTGRIRDTAAAAGVLIVDGEPDVGKSALALRAAERLEQQDAAVTVLSLADLLAGTLEL